MAMKESYYTVDGQMLGYKGASGRKDFLRDNLGSVTAEIDQTGSNRTFDGRYRSYGNLLWSTGTSGKFGWVGTWGYRSTGLNGSTQYVRARHYNYVSGSWTTQDPLWPREQPYAYAQGRSTAAIDSLGLCGDPVTGHPIPPDPIICYGQQQLPPPTQKYTYTHPCSSNPCNYTWSIGAVGPDVQGYVACCLGVAYACVNPVLKKDMDPSVAWCVYQHEKEHTRSNSNCGDVFQSGCRGQSPPDPWSHWPHTINGDECKSYRVEATCLGMALNRYGCSPSQAPTFGGNKKCRELYTAIEGACLTGKEYCGSANSAIIHDCKKWKLI